jgi:methionyl-tRNA formyltransferase
MRIVFMGTPDFAVPSLRKIDSGGHDVRLVVTQPDRPAGRGRKLTAPPVKLAALDLGIPIEQPETVNTDEFAIRLRSLAPDVLVVVAFGQILKQKLLDIPSRGAVNAHASLLPDYRGVAPINWVIINGESETGVTTMYMARKVDAGEIILSRSTSIGPDETAGELYERLSDLSGDLLVETLALIERGEAPRIPQGEPSVGYARKLRKEDGEIDWARDARTVADHIRGMTPWPGAYTWFRGKTLLVTRARQVSRPRPATPGQGVSEASITGRPGEILSISDAGIEVATAGGAVLLTGVKPEGKREMTGAEFVRGYRPESGTCPFVRADA